VKKIITYGTFDLLHVGHVRLLERIAALGDHLTVAVSTDDFNERKKKRAVYSFEERAEIVRSIRFVNEVIPENNWEQKRDDIQRLKIDAFAIGHDWTGKFDELKDLCEVVYLPRTDGISTTSIKDALSQISPQTIKDVQTALELLQGVIGNIK